MVVKYKMDALDSKDFAFLQEYITDDPSIAWQRFPMYSFLPKDEPAENHIEKILRAITPGKEHIEYWFRWNDQSDWHVDGDEILFKQKMKPEQSILDKKDQLDYNPEDPNSSRVARTTNILYLSIQNIIGGELQICTSHPWDGKYILNNKHEPPNGAKVTTIRPFQNMAVQFPSNLYHRVKNFIPKLEGFPMKRLVLVWCYWDHHPQGYKDHKHWKLTKEFNFVPARGWRDFTIMTEGEL
jgi:hypothetical protein|tara:strand:- start:2656 stop:3375 length:720 start_codon:yes stop_codon:yes gene_type:complete